MMHGHHQITSHSYGVSLHEQANVENDDRKADITEILGQIMAITDQTLEECQPRSVQVFMEM